MKISQDWNKEIKKFLEFNENENTIYPNLWEIMKAVLRCKLTPLSGYIKQTDTQINWRNLR